MATIHLRSLELTCDRNLSVWKRCINGIQNWYKWPTMTSRVRKPVRFTVWSKAKIHTVPVLDFISNQSRSNPLKRYLLYHLSAVHMHND
ncbi:hypothetical protein BABINDRAFT_103543 [Babjeviella inositovora NRRL Y-12698]|uniref:Uncharacterized protein n=1 Tax=Babjeviella inositovora NRRL Y-12698 TaxID=984486 RepID=A0A1E3QHV3_9ASCO|nr:uncharacterized protein BABINDRAFT_103543 [Babjeviella inositovora NRRL Y-12698]ODQ77220.1 hypothetical protein BABINDRAFT_103543 [Babjeviella inositovora NRRL Y-12698]